MKVRLTFQIEAELDPADWGVPRGDYDDAGLVEMLQDELLAKFSGLDLAEIATWETKPTVQPLIAPICGFSLEKLDANA